MSLTGRSDLTGQIYRQIRSTVIDGTLRAGAMLPSSRELAARLSVSRNTVASAYDRLVAEGFLTSRAGAGTYVSAGVSAPAPTDPTERSDAELAPRAVWEGIPELGDLSAANPVYDFRAGITDARLFPYPTWRNLVADALRPTAVGSGTHITPAGLVSLREAVARHVAVSRGIHASAEDVIVTTGIQQVVDLVIKVLLEPGDTVAVEDPGYGPPQLLFRAAGLRVAAVPVDSEGVVVDALPDDARVVYLTPSHQFPLGMSMSLARRLELLRWAERTGAVLLEDDYDSEFRYAGRPIEPLHSLDQRHRVVYAASFSKVMLPTLRLGYLVMPPTLRVAFGKAKQLTDWHTSVPMQAALARFVDSGALARHIRRMRHAYAARHHLIEAVLRRDFAGLLEPVPAMAGLHLSAEIVPGGPADEDVVDRARAVGLALEPLSRYAIDVPRNGLLLGYGGIAADRIEDGLKALRGCFDD